MNDTRFPMEIASAEELGVPVTVAPRKYRPRLVAFADMVYDDEVENGTLEKHPGWRNYFAGGSNRPHWILVDDSGDCHFVETTGWGGSYDVYGPDYAEHFANAYDAFWTAEQHADLSTDPNFRTWQGPEVPTN